MIAYENGRLYYRYDAETLMIEPWGANAFRVRAWKQRGMPEEDWALTEPVARDASVRRDGEAWMMSNGKITARLSSWGKLTFYNQRGETILEEYHRTRRDITDPKCSAIEVEGRGFRPLPGADYHLTARFESLAPDERLYGMGQYQQPCMNLKGADLELAHRNSQASVPFLLSSLGYGFLWNNPAVGRAVLGKNLMSFEAYSTKALDYWVVAGDAPKEITASYASVTGTAPEMPEYGLGFWQCKLRYQTQDELLSVAREYKRRGLPIDVIVVDFFHWPKQGDWKFDPVYWPDPEGMVRELKGMGIELMVSIWPTVDKTCENYAEMRERGYLVRCDRGVQVEQEFMGSTVFFDATNPDARAYVWNKAKENYHDKGVRLFWLDEAEPEYSAYDFDNYRCHLGSNLQVANLYPVCYAKTFYDGMLAAGQKGVVNLLRCAWAGSQKYGALVWSGDIASSFESMRNQLVAGLNMGISGIPWWTTDIGGFHGGDPGDEKFRELFVRWFQWAAFCPVMRLHGDRMPRQAQFGTSGGAACCSGAPNEVWSYGERVYEICVKYLRVRESLREYTRALMKEAHENGTPLMRPLFYEFPDDPLCGEIEDQYCYGSRYLVAPVLYAGEKRRRVYLPRGCEWTRMEGGGTFSGGRWVEAECPLETMPVFVRTE